MNNTGEEIRNLQIVYFESRNVANFISVLPPFSCAPIVRLHYLALDYSNSYLITFEDKEKNSHELVFSFKYEPLNAHDHIPVLDREGCVLGENPIWKKYSGQQAD